ncbi:hypothetical protein GJ496_009098 [Pomphorhynchus laevis]|nr:hypothetical protein GJ496_009098 [Pomphorhynchus laevis]
MLVFLTCTYVSATVELKHIPNVSRDIKPDFERIHNGKVYIIFQPRNIWWLMSQKLCEHYQGHLAVPNNDNTYKFLVKMIRDYYVKLSFLERDEMHGFHVGIRSVSDRWIPEEIDWCSGEPKNHGACAEFSTKHGFCINDVKCTENRKRGVICETPLFVIDQPERGQLDQRVICMKPANFSEAKKKSNWYEAERWCRTLGMNLVDPSVFQNRPCGGLFKKAPTAVDGTLLDGIWNADGNMDWCPGHPLADRQCALQFGNCYRSVRCKNHVMQRFCCSAMLKRGKNECK